MHDAFPDRVVRLERDLDVLRRRLMSLGFTAGPYWA